MRHQPNEFDYINRTYNLSIGRGSRVEYTGDPKTGPRQGIVTSTNGQHINVRFDGDSRATGPFHPTWEMRQLIGEPS